VDVNIDPPFPGAPAFLAARLLAAAEFIGRFRPRVLSTTLALAAADAATHRELVELVAAAG
jgi:myo-inositol-1(or 4)-monophosphatase